MNEDSKIYSKRFVCCADILGFSNKFLSLSIGNKIRKYAEIVESLKDACHSFKDYSGEQSSFQIQRINFHWFSDFFILFSDQISDSKVLEDIPHFQETKQTKITNFLQSVKILFLHFLYLGFPLRGGIDFGEFIHDPDQNTFLGEAMIRAVKLAEQHEWAGISLTSNSSEELLKFSKAQSYLTYYIVPTKGGGGAPLMVIDWPKDNTIKKKTNLEEYISRRFEELCPNLTENVKTKLINTQDFVNSRISNLTH